MSIERLRRIVIPPDHPIEIPGEEQWGAVTSVIAPLPRDYRDFVNTYGTGSIDAFIWVFNPVSNNPNINLSNQFVLQLEVLREINNSNLEPCVVLFPEQSGVLPFGITDNGDVLLWVTNGDANNWTVGVLPARTSPIVHFPMNMTDFLAGIFERTVHCPIFPEDFPSDNPVFVAGN